MADKKVWIITGAGRGMGVDIAQAALAAGHAVVATGRNTDAVADAIGESDDLLVVELDVRASVGEAAVQAARRALRPHRRTRQQRGQLPCGLLRGADTGSGRAAADDKSCRADERHARVLPVMREQRSGK